MATIGASVRNRKTILAVILIGLAMTLLQVSSVNNLLPIMSKSLEASTSSSQWVLSGYALATGILLVSSGRLGDLFGQGRLFVIGLTIFGLGSLGCGLAWNAGFLNLMRIVQGLGAGVYSPQIFGIIQRYFKGRDRARAFGYVGLVVAVSVATGPVMSGALVAWLGEGTGWRWSFLVNVPVAAAGVVASFAFLPMRRERRDGTLDIDPLGMSILVLAVVGLMLPFLTAFRWKWFLLPLAAGLGWAWVRWERHYGAAGRSPMVDLRLFRLRSFSYGICVTLFMFLGSSSVFALVALFLQKGLETSPLQVGLICLPSGIGSGIGALWAGRHTYEEGARIQARSLAACVIALLLSTLTAWGTTRGIPGALMAVPLAFVGLSFGLMGSANTTETLRDVPPEQGATAGGAYQTAQRVTTAIGNAVVTAVFFSIARGHSTQSLTTVFHAYAAANAVIIAVIAASFAVAFRYLANRNAQANREASAKPKKAAPREFPPRVRH